MNNLVIPPSANWYETLILACAPDNTLIYGSRNDIVIIYDSPDDQPSDVKIIHRAHSQKIISTNINRNWGQPHKLLVTVAEDNVVKLWDIETRKKKLGHNAHVGHAKVIGATFAGDDRVISASEDGIIIVWNITQNQTNVLKEVFGSKVTITCISTCPHAIWLTAFGLKNGLVIVTDLRKQGKVLYKLRGHDKSVLCLSWCPAPVNIFPKDPRNYVGLKNPSGSVIERSREKKDAGSEGETDKILEIKSKVVIEESPEKKDMASPEGKADQILEASPKESVEQVSENVKSDKVNKRNIWSNLKHADDDELGVSSQENNHPLLRDVSNVDDFLKECQNLRNVIIGRAVPEATDEKCDGEKERVIIKAKRKQDKTRETRQNLEDQAGSSTNTKNETDEINDVLETFEKELDKLGSKSEADDLPTDEGAEEVKPQSSSDETNVEESKDSIKGTESAESPGVDSDKVGLEAVEGKINDEKIDIAQDNVTCGEAKREIPVNVPVEEEPRREFLLASSGKEGNIYIWRAGTDGRMQTFLNVPHKTGHRKSGKSSSDKLWIVLCWISPTVLLSSSKSAELMKWTLPKPKDKKKQFSVLHCDHNSMLFSIAAPIVFLNEHNWLDERKMNVWTVGHDRLLLNTDLTSERKNLACYPTLGNAECLALSPVDPNRLAIGTAEGVIKIWDLSRPNVKNIVMTSFFQKIQSKVVTLAWHPTNELILAYGTSEGRIGFLDTSNKSKTPTVPPNYFKSRIHKLEWGPINGNKEDLGLFAVAEGKLVIYSVKKSEKGPTEVDVPDDTFMYTFAWKPDYTMLVVGTNSGTVVLYSPDLKILSTHYFQHRLNDIYWHPDAAQSDPNASERCYRFAAISNSKDVIVCNFQRDIADGEKIVLKYEQSDEIINFVSWSPYASDELVIAGDDGTAQVWNVEGNTVTSTYTSPNFEGILSSIWSPIDSDYIISAVKDHTIRVWRISDHPRQEDKEIKELRKKIIKEITKEQMDLLPKAEKPQEEPTPKNKATKNNLLPNFFYPKDTPQVIDDLKKLFLWKEGSHNVEAGGGDNNCNILKVFGSKSDMLDVIERNDTAHREKGKFSLSNTLSLFKGDIGSKIKKAVDEKRVNPWMITMAPMVSPKLWQSACEVYAHQLSETADSDPVEIATYYLACHKVEEAIDALCEGAMYREALVLAKCRLPEDDSTITNVMNRWAKYSVIVGNFEAAAQCYICLKKYEDAASVLFRRSDVKTLKFATELAEKSGNEELHKAVLFRYNAYREENGTEEKELPSKLDAVLKSHLENGGEDKKAVVEETVDSHDVDGGVVEIQSGEKACLEDDKIEGRVDEEKVLNKGENGGDVEATDNPTGEIVPTDNVQ
ncbi:gem-associated protein 5 isoform X2 [Anoplophora glabripennis]|uniref:gem-associated protein 5 isoform X2 n=1 Tax=Anoplophora glabripennis TaxID=217634 RepID=UPI000873F2B6|nr:gem-associated protein 5 isoform X2 [Anoplophora glabripennis]